MSKKLLAVSLSSIAMLLGLVGCKSRNKNTNTNNNNPSSDTTDSTETEVTITKIEDLYKKDELKTAGGKTAEALNVEGTVTGLNGTKGFYIQDDTAGVLIYYGSYSGEKTEVAIGNKVQVNSKFTNYGMTLETNGAPDSVKVIESSTKQATAKDVTDLSTLKWEDQSQLINISNAELASTADSKGNFTFKLGETTMDAHASSSDSALSSTLSGMKVGDKLNLKNVYYGYFSSKPQITVISADRLEKITK